MVVGLNPRLAGQQFLSPTMQLDVIDRISGGDGFAIGLIYGLINGRPPEEALRLGWAHGALLTTFPMNFANGAEFSAYIRHVMLKSPELPTSRRLDELWDAHIKPLTNALCGIEVARNHRGAGVRSSISS